MDLPGLILPRDGNNTYTPPPRIVYNGPLGSSTLFGFTVRIVTIILLVFTVVACWAIAITAASKVKRRKDPARCFVPWMQAGLFIISTAIMFQIAYIGCQLADRGDDDSNGWSALNKITTTMQASASLLLMIAEIVAWVALVLLDNGIGLVKPVEVTKKRIRTTRATYWFAGFWICFQFVIWAISLATLWPQNENSSATIAPFVLDVPSKGLLAIAILAILIRAIVIRVRFRKAQHIKRICRYYLACACLLFVTMLYEFVFTYTFSTVFIDAYIRFNGVPQDWYSASRDADAVIALVQCLIEVWPIFIVLVILFAEGLKVRDGLFTAGAGDGPLMQEVAGLVGSSPQAQPSEHPPSLATPSDVETPAYSAVAGSQSPQAPRSPTDARRSAEATDAAATSPSAAASVARVPTSAASASGSTSHPSIPHSPGSAATAGEASIASAPIAASVISSSVAPSATGHVPNSQSQSDASSSAAYSQHHESHDPFHWPIPDEAPPEYTAPERPLPNMPASMPAMTPVSSSAHAAIAHQEPTIAHQAAQPQSPQQDAPQQSSNEAGTSSNAGSTEPRRRSSTEFPLSSTLPSHDEAMGLNHQADGRQPHRLHPDIPEELLNEIPRDKKS